MSTPQRVNHDIRSDLGEPSLVPEISIVIVSWNTRRYLEDCLASLSQGIARTCEIIVVDNASGDGSPEMVRANFPQVRLIESGANLGFARGNNLAFQTARGRYVCLINSDVLVFAGALDGLAAYLDQHPECGMVGPRILNADRSLQSTCRQFPTLRNKFNVVSGLSRLFPQRAVFSGEEMLWFAHDRESQVNALVGCFIMVRAGVIQQIGGLDERFFMYGEDVDWCQRCRESGWRVTFFPGVESIHFGGASSANSPQRFSVELQRAAIQLWEKHYSTFVVILFRTLLLTHCCLRAIRELVLAARHRGWTEAGRKRFAIQRVCIADLFALTASANRATTGSPSPLL